MWPKETTNWIASANSAAQEPQQIFRLTHCIINDSQFTGRYDANREE
jgi:hypothetical protein